MNPSDATAATSTPALSPPSASPSPPRNEAQPYADFKPEDAAAAVARLERLLREVRGALEARERESDHREFSIVRLVGAVCQMAAVGMFLWAIIDWVFQPLLDQTLVKAVFSGVLQFMALTAFVVSRPRI